jgi:hypothetical protein
MKNLPFKLDSYKTRKKRVHALNRPDNIYARGWFSNIAVLAFVFIDLFCLKVVWNLVQTENPMYVWCVAFACAAALDVPLAIAAISMKRYQQGLCTKMERNIVLSLSITVFAIAFAFSFAFRVLTRDFSFDVGTSTTLTNTLASGTETDDSNVLTILFASLFNGVIPLLTSISSFVISYFGCNPIDMKLAALEKERIELQANILEAKRALAETETAGEHCSGLIARENDLYAAFMSKLDADEKNLKQLVRVILMEKLNSPETVTAMITSAEEIHQENVLSKTPGQELTEFVKQQISEDEIEKINAMDLKINVA